MSSEQPKEYIITEKQLRHYIKFSKYPSSEMDEAIRSRPHPAPAHSGWIRESFLTLYSNKLFTVGEVCNLVEGHRAEAARQAREDVLTEMTKLSRMIETNETERWESCGRPKNDGYINGSHSGYGHALRDMRQWIDQIKKAAPNSRQASTDVR